MSESLHSDFWYRVDGLRPLLRPHVEVHRHRYRGDAWYVLADSVSGRHHRLSAAAWSLVGLMDGERSIASVWELTVARLGDDAPTQDEVIRVLAQLHAADMLRCDVSPDALEMFERHAKARRSKWRQQATSPLAIRIPLFDPNAFVAWLLPVVRPLFTRAAACVAALLVVVAMVLTLVHWPELSADFARRALTPTNLLLIGLLYPLVKVVHELGHALAVRRWGGEVHEMGVILLALIPMPYVDASAASAFRDKRRRMAVGAAGIVVELLLASVALLVWLTVEPGLVRTIAWNVMLIGGVSTVLFNGNPLLRFDGYYVLADAIEIPNLASRANRYLGYLVERYAFGSTDARSPATANGEGPWFVAYGIAAACYRVLVIVAIVLVLADRYPIVGMLVGAWALAAYVIWPLGRVLHHLFTSARLARRRVRAVTLSMMLTSALVLAVLVVPFPLATRAEGVVHVPDDGIVRTGTECFVVDVLVEAGSSVTLDAPLIRCEDPLLPARVRELEASLRELEARERVSTAADHAGAGNFADQRRALEAQLRRSRERAHALVVRSPATGTLVLPGAADMPGRYFRQGAVLGYVIDPGRLRVRAVVRQQDMGLVRARTRAVALRPAEAPGVAHSSRILREVPAAGSVLPSQALGSAGGGVVAVDLRDEAGRQALEPFFELDLALPETWQSATAGGRVHVRFDHGGEALAWRWQRGVRRLLLGRFDG